MTWFIRRMRLFWVMAGLLWSTAGASAAPMFGDAVELVQPDGTRLEVRAWGDEFYQVYETADGYTLVEDPKSRVWCYAQATLDGSELLSTGVPAGSVNPLVLNLQPHARHSREAVSRLVAEARAAMPRPPSANTDIYYPIYAPLPRSGMVRGVCILIAFPDVPPVCTPAEVDALFNEPGYSAGGNVGSVRDYFYDASDGQYTYTNYVLPVWYMAENPSSYYRGNWTRERDLYQRAITFADPMVDFSQFNVNGDEYVDAVNFLVTSVARTQHCSGIVLSAPVDGLPAVSYQVSGISPPPLRMGVICHENGHLLFNWPDLYDFGDPAAASIGVYCVMCTPMSPPAGPCPYIKHLNGWSTQTTIGPPATGRSLTSGCNQVFKYSHPTDPREYFLIENRSHAKWGSSLPDAGLCIWHVDEAMTSNQQQLMLPHWHYLISLEQADGRFDLEHNANVGDFTDLYGGPDARQFSEVTVPSSRWWSGQSSGLIITNISDPGPVMTFDIRLVGDCDGDGVPDGQEIAAGAADCNANATPDSCEPDRDSDGAVDSCDNCRELANSDQSDGDGDGWGDACDACPGTIPGGAIIEGCPPGVPYDLDIDGDVDEDDLQQFEACAAGPGVLPADWLCGSLDIDLDGDIDQVEFAYLQRCWSGRDVLGDLDCWMP